MPNRLRRLLIYLVLFFLFCKHLRLEGRRSLIVSIYEIADSGLGLSRPNLSVVQKDVASCQKKNKLGHVDHG